MLERCFDNSWIFTNNVIVQTNDKPMLPATLILRLRIAAL